MQMTASELLQGLLAPLYALYDSFNPTGNFMQLTILVVLTLGIIGVIIKNIMNWR